MEKRKKTIKLSNTDRRNRMTKKQQSILIHLICDNRDMLDHMSSTSKHWNNASQQLNQMGPKKSTSEWIDAYKLLARKVKLKFKRLQEMSAGANLQSTAYAVELSKLDKLLLQLEGYSVDFNETPSCLIDVTPDPMMNDVKSERTTDSPISFTSDDNNEEISLERALETSTKEICSAIRSLGDSIVLAAKIITGQYKDSTV